MTRVLHGLKAEETVMFGRVEAPVCLRSEVEERKRDGPRLRREEGSAHSSQNS